MGYHAHAERWLAADERAAGNEGSGGCWIAVLTHINHVLALKMKGVYIMWKTLFSRIPALGLWVILGFALSLSPFTTTPCRADTGDLKLKVRGCMGTNWLSNAKVDVVIYRPGTGKVDAATGHTDSSGYVKFTFTSLQSADEAHVTVTPVDKSPDANHRYTWDQGVAGDFDLAAYGDSLCSDSWYDESNHVIECVYSAP